MCTCIYLISRRPIDRSRRSSDIFFFYWELQRGTTQPINLSRKNWNTCILSFLMSSLWIKIWQKLELKWRETLSKLGKSINRDITVRKRAEIENHYLNAKLHINMCSLLISGKSLERSRGGSDNKFFLMSTLKGCNSARKPFWEKLFFCWIHGSNMTKMEAK